MTGVRPARALERAGLVRTAHAARELRWAAAELRPLLRPDRAARLTRAWMRDRAGRRGYRLLSEDELRSTRSSDTAFVFGSGRSILEIGPEEWRRIAQHDTVTFSSFHRLRAVRIDYHLVAEVVDRDETGTSIRSNPCYADTVFLVVEGWIAEAGNDLVGRRLLPPGARIFRYRRVARGRIAPPNRSFADGLVHGANTSFDAVNFALLMGWRRIVVAGVDLYDKRYFWLGPNETRAHEHPGVTAATPFPSAGHIVEMFGLWREAAAHEGTELLVYNPRSLLAQALPVFRWS